MREIFEQLILDFHHSKLPVPVKREIDILPFSANIRKAHVLIGMRRSGKTWTMYQRMNGLLGQGLDMTKILYINFEDDRLISMQTKDFQSILDAYFGLYPQHLDASDVHFFFDEIHEVKGWEQFIRRLLDREKMHIYISGSSAKLLGKEIASALRGRTMVTEIFPFSFREYLNFKGLSLSPKSTTKEKMVISHCMKDFLQYGGFPEAVSLDKRFFNDLLQGYIDSVIYRDIVERYNISNVHVIRELITFCLQNLSSLISINKIYNTFKSQGESIGKNSLYEFMGYLEDAYCVFSVPIFSHSRRKQAVNPKKIYAVDQGFITAYTVKPQFEEASRLENAVFCRLRQKNENIFYYKTKKGKELDFLSVAPNGKKDLYQVSVSISDKKAYDREVSALKQAMEELGAKEGIIITLNDKKTITFKKRLIHCIPAWQWLI